LAEDHVGEVKVELAVVRAHHLRRRLRVACLKRRQQPGVHHPVGLGRYRADLPGQDDVPLRPGRNGIAILDQDLIVRSAVDHAVKRPVDVQHAAHRHRDPGVPQVAKRLLLVLAGDQLPRGGQFVLRHLRSREPRRQQIELPSDFDQLGRLLTGERRDDHVPVRYACDQVVRFQPPQRLAQRRDGDAQGGRELYVVNPAARLKHAVEDLVPHLQVDAVGLCRLATGPIAVRHRNATLPSIHNFIL
jgi:hypothetical protein